MSDGQCLAIEPIRSGIVARRQCLAIDRDFATVKVGKQTRMRTQGSPYG
jgi:hypothetical protein